MKVRTAPLVLAAGFLLSVAVPDGVMAQEGCTCLLPAVAAGARVGSVGAIVGDVMMSMPAGYIRAEQGATIVSGSRVVVGSDSSVALAFDGSCSFVAPASAIVMVAPAPTGTCVAVNTIEVAPVADANVAQGLLSGLPNATLVTGALGFAALGLGVLIAVDVGRDNPISR